MVIIRRLIPSYYCLVALSDDGFNSASKRQFKHYSPRQGRKYTTCPVSGYLLVAYFDCRSDNLMIENLATGHLSVFNGNHLMNFVDVICVVSDNQYLVSIRTATTEVRILMLHTTDGSVMKICDWDFTNLAEQNSIYGCGRDLRPKFNCAISASHGNVVIIGPAKANAAPVVPDLGKPDPRQGIKSVRLKHDPPVIQVCIPKSQCKMLPGCLWDTHTITQSQSRRGMMLRVCIHSVCHKVAINTHTTKQMRIWSVRWCGRPRTKHINAYTHAVICARGPVSLTVFARNSNSMEN